LRYVSSLSVAFNAQYLHESPQCFERIQADGWILVATKISHRQFKHPAKPGRVTIPGKLSDDLAIGTLKSILRQAGLKP
jgi:predicted RNA binding protein YcfA (HicA-like mRNA interferase family)